MATISEMFVDIGADASDFERETSGMERQMKGLQSEMKTMAAAMGTNTAKMGRDWQAMSQEMRDAFKQSKNALMPFKKAQQEVKYEFFKMAQGMKNYQGTNKDFMKTVAALGKKHKKATEDMIKNNDLLKTSFVQNVGIMLNRSGQSEKIAANFDRIGNPLYKVNNGLLKITSGLEGIARAGMPAVLALSMLGPTANMKQLQDMTMMISQGLMRFTSVALAAGLVSVLMFKGLNDAAKKSVPGYKEALGAMGSSVREAFQPMVDVFGAVMKKVFEFITVVANLVSKFNEAHPVLAKVIQGILLLIPILTLILAPLAIGIGLWAGMQAALGAVWMLIGPLVTGLGAMLGTVLLVAAAIAIVGVALWALWTKTSWFKEAVIGAWEAIKTATQAAWSWMMDNIITPIVTALVAFVSEQLKKVQQFWDENGAMIMAAAQKYWSFVQGYIKVVMAVISAIMAVAWPLIKAIIQNVWESIKSIVSGAIDVILGIIQFFAALFTGNWSAMWAAVKQIWSGAISMVVGFLKMSFIGTIISSITAFVSNFGQKIADLWNKVKKFFSDGVNNAKETLSGGVDKMISFLTGMGSTFFNAGKGLIDMMADGIENAAGKVISKVKSLAKKVRDFLPFSPAKTGPLSDLDRLDFGGPIGDSLIKGMPKVQRLMSDMLTMPAIDAPSVPNYTTQTFANQKQQQVVYVELDGRTIARGTLPHMEREIRLKTGLRFN